MAWLGERAMEESTSFRIAIANECDEPVTLRFALRGTPESGFALAGPEQGLGVSQGGQPELGGRLGGGR